MASVFLFPYVVSLVCSILLSVPSHTRSISVKPNDGFSVSLIHRDSPQSPFYNHSMTTYERNVEAARRSINRQRQLIMSPSFPGGITATTSDPPDISATATPYSFEFITIIYMGTPRNKIFVQMDPGSGLNWVKGPPVFDASKSISYKLLACSIDPCPSLSSCNSTADVCEFLITYVDQSTSSGIISYEDFDFDGPNGENLTVYNLQFGYATQAIGFDWPRQDGILGLNRDPESFISQLGIKKFSHCFGSEVSRMYFGSSAVMANLSTPIEPSMTIGYYVTLDGVSIGDKLVDMPPGVFKLNDDGTGGVMLDFGSTYTHLTSEAYEPFKNEMMKHVNRPILATPASYFDLCFNGTLDDLGDLPDVTFWFARVRIQFLKEVVYVDAADGVLCLAILPSSSDVHFTTIGTYQMRYLLVGYDLERMEISFGPANCSAF